MACANVEMLPVSSTLAYFNNGYRKKNYNGADKTYNSCGWPVWPTATQEFNIKLWPVQVVVLGYLQWQNINVTKGTLGMEEERIVDRGVFYSSQRS